MLYEWDESSLLVQDGEQLSSVVLKKVALVKCDFGQLCLTTKIGNVILGCIAKGKTCKICEIISSSVLFMGKDSAQVHYSFLGVAMKEIDQWDLLSLKN